MVNVVFLFALTLPGLCAPLPVLTQTLKVGETTIHYSPGMEAQAQELALAAEAVMPEIRSQTRQVSRYLGDTKGLAKRIAEMLGQPKAEASLRKVLQDFNPAYMDKVMAGIQNDWRIYRLADLRAGGPFTEGLMTVSYDSASNIVNTQMQFKATSGKMDAPPATFLLFIINDDGTFKYDRKKYLSLADEMRSMPQGLNTMRTYTVHEAVEKYLADDRKISHPYTRWFTEGVANWVAYRLGIEAIPSLTGDMTESAFPQPDDPLREQINLPAWVQYIYTGEINPDLDRAQYRFATEMIRRCLEGQPDDALGKIINTLGKAPNPDTTAICRAIQAVTGVDAQALMQDYVPAQVKEDIRKNQLPVYLIMARRDEPQKMADMLTRYLQADPNNPLAHLRLAWALRKLGALRADTEQQIRLTCALGLSDEDLFQFSDNDEVEVAYIVARIHQLCGDTKTARTMLTDLLQRYPQHADARLALEEMKK